MRVSHVDRVIRYYDDTRWDYKHLWRSDERGAIHFGYFDESVRGHRESLTRMTQVLAEHAGIERGDRVLDAGCGLGGCALWLAEHVGCEVVGVNVTPFQVHSADQEAMRRGLGDRARFLRTSYTSTGLQAGSFTVVWALESVVHAERKEDFVAEAARLLAPGGRLMLAEYLVRDEPPLDEAEQATLDVWLDGWAMPGLWSEARYREALADAGFEQVDVMDISDPVTPSLDKLGTLIRWLRPTAPGFHRLGVLSAGALANLEASHAQLVAFEQQLWCYKVVTAMRSG